jgi:hypothetical protein
MCLTTSSDCQICVCIKWTGKVESKFETKKLTVSTHHSINEQLK